MSVWDYITNDINLSKAQFEAISNLAKVCGMKSIFESEDDDDDFGDDDATVYDDAKGEQIETNTAKKEAEKAKEKAMAEEKSIFDDEKETPDESVLGIDEMFDINKDLSGGVSDDNADVGGKEVDYDFTNPEKVSEDTKAKEETKLQKDSRVLVHTICQLAGIGADKANSYEDCASAAVDYNDQFSDYMAKKLGVILSSMSDIEKQRAYSDELLDEINRYMDENPDSPIIKCLATFLKDLDDAHMRQDSASKNAIDDALRQAYGLPVGSKVMSSKDIRDAQKKNMLSRVRNNKALSGASVGFDDPAEEARRQAGLDKLAQQGVIA